MLEMLVAREIEPHKWEKEKSLCSHCGRLVSNKSYFSGPHLRSACRPAWKIRRETFEWEIENRRPRRADWRWKGSLDCILKAPNGSQQVLFEALPERKKVIEDMDPNQLEFHLTTD